MTAEVDEPVTAEVDIRERVRQQARETYRQSLAAEMPLTGRQLGEMFDRSDRWGRDRITEVRADDHAAVAVADGNSGERQPDTEPRRQPAAPRDPAGRAVATGTRAVPVATAQPPPQPVPSGDSTRVSGKPGLAAETGTTATAAPTAQPLPRPAMEPLIAPAPHTVPEAGTRQAPITAPAASSPAVSVAIRRTTVAAVTVVAAVAAVVSFAHMHDLALRAGEGWRAWLLPLAVDGLIIAASMTMLVRRRHGTNGGPLAWASLILGITASLAANVAAATPTWEGRIVAAWPPIALLLAYELLMQQVRNTHHH